METRDAVKCSTVHRATPTAKTNLVPASIAPQLRKPGGELGTAEPRTVSPQLSAALWSWNGSSGFLRSFIKCSMKMVSELLAAGEFRCQKLNIFKLFT